MASEILRFTEKPVIDESVQEYQFHEYEPQARTNLNSAGEIVINIFIIQIYQYLIASRPVHTSLRKLSCL